MNDDKIISEAIEDCRESLRLSGLTLNDQQLIALASFMRKLVTAKPAKKK